MRTRSCAVSSRARSASTASTRDSHVAHQVFFLDRELHRRHTLQTPTRLHRPTADGDCAQEAGAASGAREPVVGPPPHPGPGWGIRSPRPRLGRSWPLPALTQRHAAPNAAGVSSPPTRPRASSPRTSSTSTPRSAGACTRWRSSSTAPDACTSPQSLPTRPGNGPCNRHGISPLTWTYAWIPTLPAARPRRQVQRRLRRRHRGGRTGRDHERATGASDERPLREDHRHHPARNARPRPHPQRGPRRARPGRLPAALQRAPPAPGPQPATARRP